MPSLMRYINIISRCSSMWRSDKLEGTELCDQHYPYILTVCRNPGISQDAIARKLFINKSTVARNLNYLEELAAEDPAVLEAIDKSVLCHSESLRKIAHNGV